MTYERIMLGVEKPVIKFSNRYFKLGDIPNGATAKLLVCQPVDLKNLPKWFINYDATFPVVRENGKCDQYPLPPSGAYLLLAFISESGVFFTTLRRSTPTKKKYYESLVGHEFEVVIGDCDGKG